MRLDLDASSDDEIDHIVTTRDLAFNVFTKSYALELLVGTHEWLEELIQHFDITDEANITDTFTHLAIGCKAGKF